MSEIVFNAPSSSTGSSITDLKSQVDSLQTTLALLNQQVISLQEALQEKDQEINDLKARLSRYLAASQTTSGSVTAEKQVRADDTLTIVGALIKLYQFAIVQKG